MEAVDTADAEHKYSKRALFKDALVKTKSKFTKDHHSTQGSQDFKLSDDVNEFLAAGRASVSSPRTSADNRSQHTTPSPRPLSESFAQYPSTRRVSIPRLDVSQSNRWPGARPVEQLRPPENDFLRPDYAGRSQSSSSFKKSRGRGRNLSVSFANAPPIVIGEGGDQAMTPPNEISKAKQRSRSLSPMTTRPTSNQSSDNSRSPIRRKPLPPTTVSPQLRDNSNSQFEPKPLRRIQTGFEESSRKFAEQALEQAFASPGSAASRGSGSPFGPPLLSPKPIRPPVTPPDVESHPPAPTFQEFMQNRGTPPMQPRRSPNHEVQMAHHPRQSPYETETMQKGAGGWI